jgi:uncharacterized protein YbjQ (UPF0145 family)
VSGTKRWAHVVALAVVASCGPFVPRTDLSSLSPAERNAALQVKLLLPGDAVPTGAQFIGDVDGFSCKNVLTDPPATRAAAFQQLQVRALRLGANAVANVTCTGAGTDALGTNCWNSVSCGGTAIKISAAN